MTPAARDIIERTMAACDGWPTPTEGAIEALCGHVRDCLREIDALTAALDEARGALAQVVDRSIGRAERP